MQNQQNQIAELKAQIAILESERNQLIQSCNQNSVKMTKVMIKNREYLQQIQDLKEENEKLTTSKTALWNLMVKFITKKN